MRPTMLLMVAAFVSAPVFAQGSGGHAAHHATPAATSPSAAPVAAMSEGEVRKLDKGAGTVTLKHGPIPNLGMPPMTMVFRAADPAMLDRVRAGDEVRFAADKVGGQYTVTRIEPSK